MPRDPLATAPAAAGSDAAPLEVHVVPHTHWDREWYHVASRFRQRLAALVDAVLHEPPHDPAAPAPGPFLLDGQAITLRDYLAVRPGAEDALRDALRRRHLEAGPWYVLADNLIPSAEAIVRNLEAGRRVLRHFGAEPPLVAYCPDTFGHPAALPAIAAGFALPVAVVWRGAGGAAHPATDLWWWEAPDGQRVLTHHLPPDGYEFGSALPGDREEAAQRWERLATLFAARNRSGIALLLNGADHHARQPRLGHAIDALQLAAAPHAELRWSSLHAWGQAIVERGAALELPVVRGELRDSYGYTWTLGGTYATRAGQKRRNARLERGLLRDVEPWMALVRLHQGAPAAAVRHDARLSMAQLPVLLHRAWEDLLATHPHDTLCGCSVDAVARGMDVQQESVAEQGKGLREAALQLALHHDPVGARARLDFDWRRLVLRNRAPRPRGGLAVVRLVDTIAHAPVGPGSAAPVDDTAIASPPGDPENVPRALAHAPVVSQRLDVRTAFERRESPQHYPDNDFVREHRVLLWVPPVPPLGLDAWDARRWTTPVPAPPFQVTVDHEPHGIVVRNGRITLTVGMSADERDEAPCITLAVDDRALPGVLSLDTQRDAGDSYTPSLRGAPETLRCTGVSVVHRGPLRATIRLTWGTAGRRPLRVATDLVVEAMSPALQCHVRGDNTRRNHRLRLVWHTDVRDGRVWADAAFGPVLRPPVAPPPGAREAVPDSMPMHRWATLANPMFGATMIADGLAEASAGDGKLALTLVRAVGQLSRADLPERPGHAGWPSPTPAAQCQGAFEARTALFLHGPMSDDLLSRVRDLCDDVLLPLVGESWRDLAWAGQVGGPALVGEAFELSAITVSHVDPDAVLLRAVNLTDRRAWGTVHLPLPGPWRVIRCRLDETPVASPEWVGQDYSFEADAREVVTLRLSRPDART